jgi:hypothetical protein
VVRLPFFDVLLAHLFFWGGGGRGLVFGTFTRSGARGGCSVGDLGWGERKSRSTFPLYRNNIVAQSQLYLGCDTAKRASDGICHRTIDLTIKQ